MPFRFMPFWSQYKNSRIQRGFYCKRRMFRRFTCFLKFLCALPIYIDDDRQKSATAQTPPKRKLDILTMTLHVTLVQTTHELITLEMRSILNLSIQVFGKLKLRYAILHISKYDVDDGDLNNICCTHHSVKISRKWRKKADTIYN